VAEQQHAQREAGHAEDRSHESIAALPDLATRAADLRLHAARGGRVDPDAADELAVDADEAALRAQIATLQTQLARVEQRAGAEQVSLQNAGGWTIPKTTAHLRAEAHGWLAQLDRAKDLHRSYGSSTDLGTRRARIDGARRTIQTVQRQVVDCNQRAEIGEFLRYAYQRIGDKILQDALVSVAVQIGIMIVTGEVAGTAVAAVRGVALVREAVLVGELIADVRKVGLAYRALELTTHAYLMTQAQGAMGGPSGASAFGENLLGMALTTAALRPFEGLFGDAAALEKELQTWAGSAKAGAKFAVKAPIEVGVGIVAAGAAHTATQGGEATAAGVDDLVTQGIALVASKFVHRHTIQMRERIERAISGADRAETRTLLQLVDALSRRAEAAGAQSALDEIRAILAAYAVLLRQETRLYQHASGDAAKAAGRQSAADHSALSDAFVEVAFRLAGLRPVVDGAVFEGTARQIADAFAAADKIGVPPTRARDPRTGVWHVTSGDRAYEVREVETSHREHARRDGATAAGDTSGSTADTKATGRGGRPEVGLQARPVEGAEQKTASLDGGSDGRGLPEYPIARSTLEPEITDNGSGKLTYEIIGRTAAGMEVSFGTVKLALTPDGLPAKPPTMSLEATAFIAGKEYALHIYDDVAARRNSVPEGRGIRTPLTRYALDMFGHFYEWRFGRPLTEWAGMLAYSNKLNFQREYARLRDAGAKEPQLSIAAVKAISFGRHRVDAGFTQLEVKAVDPEVVDLGEGLGAREVPTHIEVIARKQ
jgi:hypothetical protein